MAEDSLFVKLVYGRLRDEALDRALKKLALSYDGHLVVEGQHLIEPCFHDIQFEFSNKQRQEQFIAALSLKHPGVTVS